MNLLHVFFVIAVLFCVITTEAADPVNCPSFKSDCLPCTNAGDGAQCGWCATSRQCLNGTKDQPYESICIGTWLWQAPACSVCEMKGDCLTCLETASCGWDEKLGKCGLIGKNDFSRKACDCNIHNTCTDCVFKKDCLWCEGNKDGKQCINTGSSCTGPIEGTCPCNQHDCDGCQSTAGCLWCQKKGEDEHVCTTWPDPDCEENTDCVDYCRVHGKNDCATCNKLNGCGWCPLDDECVDVGKSSCQIRHVCEIANCTDIETCDRCTLYPGCAWCETPGECIDPYYNHGRCYYTHSCAVPSRNFDFASYVGGMFLVIVVALIGGFAYVAWQRRQDQAAYEYSENTKL